MTPFQAATAALTALGSVVLALAAGRTRALLRMRQLTPHARGWQLLLGLMLLFIASYLAAIVAIVAGALEAVAALTGAIFLGGAVFVLLAVRTSIATLKALVESSMSQRQVGDVLEALGDAVLLIDDRGVIRMVNRKLCELTGQTASALLGRLASEVLGFEIPLGSVNTTADMPYYGEHELRRRDGAQVPVSVAVVPAEARAGVVCVLKDIRDERQRRRQLDDAVRIAEEVLRARNEFMALIAVELQDPLTKLSRACVALHGAPTGADPRPLVNKIGTASEALERVVNGLVEIGRLGGSAEGAREFYPAKLLREISESLAPAAARTGTDIRHYVEQGVPTTFYGREQEIRQVLELLGQYSVARAPAGEVRLAVEPVPGDTSSTHLLFSVRDTGPSLSDSQADLDFDPMSSGARGESGRLDLMICRLLVLSLGGRMSAGNTAGHTATIFFTVLGGEPPSARARTRDQQHDTHPNGISQSWSGSPLDASARRLAKLAVPEAPSAAAEAERRRGTILVVDDSATSRELLSHQLKQAGHAVETAGTASEALDLVWQQEFDVILLDVLLPDSDGIAVLDELRKQGMLERLSVLMISAVDETTSVAACIERGAEDFLPKPVSPAILRARLGACLEKKFLRDKSKQQLGQLAAESRRANGLLRVLLPDAIADELQATGQIEPRRHDNVAVMFADLVGFTAYCDRHSPEEVLVSLQELFTTFESLAHEHGVQKIKTIGDSFMGAAGLFGDEEQPALRCVALGRAMVAAIAGHSAGWTLRIGVHVGPVVGGVVGTRQYLYDIWGDTVNTAQRIEHSGRVGAVCVSEEARRQIEPRFVTQSLGRSELKGKGEVEIFEVVEERR